MFYIQILKKETNLKIVTAYLNVSENIKNISRIDYHSSLSNAAT